MQLVSVVVPTYNRDALLVRAVKSVLSQTWTNLEVIVVDDGGDPGCEAALMALGDDRVRYVWQDNRGAAAARNTGMTHARGQLLGFLDSDDEYLPKKLEIQAGALSGASSTVVGVDCGAYHLDSSGAERLAGPSLKGGGRASLLAHRCEAGLTPTILYRTALLQGIRWDEHLLAYQDFDFVLQVLARGDVLSLSTPLVRVHHHAGERITDPRRHLEALAYLRRKWQADIEADAETDAYWHFKVGRLHVRCSDHAAAASAFKSGARLGENRSRRVLAAASFGDGVLLRRAWSLYVMASRIRSGLASRLKARPPSDA